MALDGALLKKAFNRSESSSISLYLSAACNCIFWNSSLSALRNSAVGGHPAEGGPPKEIIRQQWNFSPTGSTREVEDYEVSLDSVAVLELAMTPDLTRREASATLAQWRVA
jgi:hypothetical protein